MIRDIRLPGLLQSIMRILREKMTAIRVEFSVFLSYFFALDISPINSAASFCARGPGF